MRMLDWRERLAGDRRVVAFTEDDRYGVLFAVAICKNRRPGAPLAGCWRPGACPGAAMRSPNTVWLEPSEGANVVTVPTPLDFTGLGDVVG